MDVEGTCGSGSGCGVPPLSRGVPPRNKSREGRPPAADQRRDAAATFVQRRDAAATDAAATAATDSAELDRAPPFHFFYPDAATEKHHGAYLPHWRQEGAIYFVTFRLADSLPREKLERWTRERAAWLLKHPEPHSLEEKAEYYDRFPRRLEGWLDAGYGSMILKDPTARLLVESAIRHFEGERYVLDAFTVAANHAHVLVAPMEGHPLSGILHSWKSYTAKEILKLPVAGRLSTAPTVWQKESWDHLVRSEAGLEKFREYIRGHG